MTAQLAIHFNPEETKNLTLCGRIAGDVVWRKRVEGVTCRRCLTALAKRNMTVVE